METNKHNLQDSSLLKNASIALGLSLVYFISQTLITLLIINLSSYHLFNWLNGFEKQAYHLLFGGCVIIAIWYLNRKQLIHLPLGININKWNLNLKNLLFVFLAVMSYLILTTTFNYWADESWNSIGFSIEKYSFSSTIKAIALSSSLISVLFVPIYEELFFRGVILRKLIMKTEQFYFSLLLSSFCFALMHLGTQTPALSFLSAFAFGSLSAFIYLNTNNLLYCIFGHFLYNLLIVIELDYATVKILMLGGLIWTIIYWLLILVSAVCMVISIRYLRQG